MPSVSNVTSRAVIDEAARIDGVIGSDWNAPRARLFIAYEMMALKDSLKTAHQELAFEKKVNDRVNEIFKGWFHKEG